MLSVPSGPPAVVSQAAGGAVPPEAFEGKVPASEVHFSNSTIVLPVSTGACSVHQWRSVSFIFSKLRKLYATLLMAHQQIGSSTILYIFKNSCRPLTNVYKYF